MSRSLWRGFDPPTTRPLPRSRNRLKAGNVHYLFSVRNMFFCYLKNIFCNCTTTDLVARPRPTYCDPLLWCFIQTDAQSRCCPFTNIHLRARTMIGKRVQFHEETWQELRLLAAESMKSFQELADEAFSDLLRKHGRPASLIEALRRSAGQTAKVIPLKRNGPAPKGRS